MPTRFWHGFADMHLVRDHEVVFRRGEGVWLEDVEGNRYLDATAGLWYCAAGYGRAEIAEAAARQMRELDAYSCFGSYVTEPTLRLAERVAALAPIPEAVVFLTTGGSEAVETAAKLARRYWDATGHPERRIIVSRQQGYHGMNAWGTELAGIAANREGYGGTIVEAVEHVPVHDAEALAALFERRGPQIAAFIAEPVVGAGGVIPPQPGYWSRVQELCRAHDVLLIADEVVTGFGRLGTWFGSERFAIAPDLITFAKVVTSGYAPLGGVIVGRRVQAPFWDGPSGPVFRHGYTYSGHATACAVALANLEILEREDLLARVRRLEPYLADRIHGLADAPLVGETRAVGLTAAVQLAADVVAADPGIAERVVGAARRHGVVTRLVGGPGLHVSPAFVIEESEIDRLVAGFRAALSEVAAGPA